MLFSAKKIFALSFLALAFVACDSGAPSGSLVDSAGSGDSEPLGVALLTPGSIRDAGWNQSAHEGLKRIEAELGARVAHQQTSTPLEFESGFRDFAARGYGLVFGHGFEFQDAAGRVAAEFPGSVFVTTSGSTIRDNVAPIVFELEQATYLLGYVGALLSRRGRLAALGGVEVPSVSSTFLAFEAGARAARPDVQVSIAYIGSWTDVAAAHEATLAQISQGADVLLHNANEAARGFFQAVRESDGVVAFGSNRNQNAIVADKVLASATLDVPRAMLLVAQEVAEERFEGRSIRFGIADGVIAVEWNGDLWPQVDEAIRARADSKLEEIVSGATQVPRLDF